uniref:Uncharacterized protein n=1 Tax=Tetraselmis sp. GSL018 TaxID=582737 RepID=A0A061QYP5_9CHLO
MASVGLLVNFRKLYKKTETQLERWSQLQALAEARLGNAVYQLERLQVLEDETGFRPFGDSVDPSAARAKQVAALEAVFGKLRESLADMEAVVEAAGRAAQDGAGLLARPAGSGAKPHLPLAASFKTPRRSALRGFRTSGPCSSTSSPSSTCLSSL